jgi:hypothetical protein
LHPAFIYHGRIPSRFECLVGELVPIEFLAFEGPENLALLESAGIGA